MVVLFHIYTIISHKECKSVIVFTSVMFSDDQTRVRLMPYEGIDGSDYINANFIDVSLHSPDYTIILLVF